MMTGKQSTSEQNFLYNPGRRPRENKTPQETNPGFRWDFPKNKTKAEVFLSSDGITNRKPLSFFPKRKGKLF